jgi:hypothetical protein
VASKDLQQPPKNIAPPPPKNIPQSPSEPLDDSMDGPTPHDDLDMDMDLGGDPPMDDDMDMDMDGEPPLDNDMDSGADPPMDDLDESLLPDSEELEDFPDDLDNDGPEDGPEGKDNTIYMNVLLLLYANQHSIVDDPDDPPMEDDEFPPLPNSPPPPTPNSTLRAGSTISNATNSTTNSKPMMSILIN